MENLILGTFCAVLFVFIVTGLPVLGALFIGFLLFAGYGLYQGHGIKSVLSMAWEGVWRVRMLLVVFMLIGVLTGLWRASGTIAYIIAGAVSWIRPSVFVLLAFLLNCGISFLLGSSFATSATMGVITFSIGQSLGVPSLYTGGAILSGAYFGDRMSPVSTSALLVSVLTETDIYKNIANMARSALVPFLVTCVLYLGIGFSVPPLPAEVHAVARPLEHLYHFTPLLLLPALSILLLSFFRVSVKKNMLVSIVLAFGLALFVQHRSVNELLEIMVWGYHASDLELAHMLDGGGISSMLRVASIVCLSSSFSGIFKGTGMLRGVEKLLDTFREKAGAYPAVLVSSIFTGLVSCNQTLTLVLTHQLCSPFIKKKETMALFLENTAEVIPALIPWSIACTGVLDTVGVPGHGAVFCAFYLILLPLWGIVRRSRV